jgi:hypothetical protein
MSRTCPLCLINATFSVCSITQSCLFFNALLYLILLCSFFRFLSFFPPRYIKCDKNSILRFMNWRIRALLFFFLPSLLFLGTNLKVYYMALTCYCNWLCKDNDDRRVGSWTRENFTDARLGYCDRLKNANKISIIRFYLLIHQNERKLIWH